MSAPAEPPRGEGAQSSEEQGDPHSRDAARGVREEARAALAVVSASVLQVDDALVQSAIGYERAALADNTHVAYERQWAAFEAWCQAHDACALPALPVTLALYLTEGADRGLAVATLGQAIAAIGARHADKGFDPPSAGRAFAKVWKGIRRKRGTAQRRVSPATIDVLRALVAALPESPIGLRDRALLVLGVAGAFRRSELVALDIADVTFHDRGMHVLLRSSKTDQEGRGLLKGVRHGLSPATCPVRTL